VHQVWATVGAHSTLKALFACRVPLPPLDEQRRIVARLGVVVEKISEAESLRRVAAEQTEAMIVSTHASLATAKPEPLSSYIALDEEVVPIELGRPYPQVGVRGFGGGLFRKQAVIAASGDGRLSLQQATPVLRLLPEVEHAIGVVEILDLHRTYGHADCFRQSDGRALVAHIRAVRQIV
jgi:hypothetical protein